MINNSPNRATHIPVEQAYVKGVKLYDIDSTILSYMESTIVPLVNVNGVNTKVPVVYANPERWVAARRDGYLRDIRGQIQIPLIMLRRNSIDRNSELQHFREHLTMVAHQKYSDKNKYDTFSLFNNIKPITKIYNIAVPAYVIVGYEVMIWTAKVDQMNMIVESFQHATDRYWGTPTGFRFLTKIDNFDTQQEMSEGTERLIRTNFNMSVNAYLLNDMYADASVVKSYITPRKLVITSETVVTDINK
jgi:hypothetical protein